MSKVCISEQEKGHFDKGYEYMQRSLTDEALAEFTKVLEINPNNIWANIELAKLCRNRLEFTKAISIFHKVLGMQLNDEQAEQTHLHLGEVYRMQGEYDLAYDGFHKALTINPDNKKLNKWLKEIDEVKGGRKKIAPYRVFFTWGMHYQCNYRCSYCYAPKPEKVDFNDNEKNRANYLSLKDWIRVWENIYNKYGTSRIRLDGGEPSVYPSFIELVAVISKLHILQINTNLSFDVDDFVKKISPERVCIDGSFHPEFVSLEVFLHKILTLRKHKFKIVASCVAYPPFLDKINEYKLPFVNLNIPFIIHPFSGEFKGKSYPKAYELEEVSKIYSLDEASRLIMSWRKGENKVTKGKLCRMGQMYGRIYPNGDTYRCCAEGGMFKIGNICNDNFQLLDEPLECSSEDCPCWKCMIVCEEERWTPQWIDEWELPPVSI